MTDEQTLTDEQWDRLRVDGLNAARAEAERLAERTRRTHYVVRTDWAAFAAVGADDYENWGYERRRAAELVETYWHADDPDHRPERLER